MLLSRSDATELPGEGRVESWTSPSDIVETSSPYDSLFPRRVERRIKPVGKARQNVDALQ